MRTRLVLGVVAVGLSVAVSCSGEAGEPGTTPTTRIDLPDITTTSMSFDEVDAGLGEVPAEDTAPGRDGPPPLLDPERLLSPADGLLADVDSVNALVPPGSSVKFHAVILQHHLDDSAHFVVVVPEEWPFATFFGPRWNPPSDATEGLEAEIRFRYLCGGCSGFESDVADSGLVLVAEPFYQPQVVDYQWIDEATIVSDYLLPGGDGRTRILTDGDRIRIVTAHWDMAEQKTAACDVELTSEYVDLADAFVAACEAAIVLPTGWQPDP